MRRQHAAVAVQQRDAGPVRLAGASAAGHLKMRFGEVRHCAGHAAMSVREQPAVQIQRHRAVSIEVAFARQCTGAAAWRQADFFKQHRQRDREAVVNRRVFDVGQRPARSGQRPGRAGTRAEVREACRRAHMLRVVKLRRRADAHRVRSFGLGRNHKRTAAVRHRAAVEHLQRRSDGARGQHVGDTDRAAELCAFVQRRMPAHQHRQFSKVGLGAAKLVHVARGDQPVVGGDRRPQRNFVDRVTDLGQDLDRRVAALPRHAVFAADHQHPLGRARRDEQVRQHHQRKAGRAAQLHRVRIARLQAVVLGKYG